MKRLLFSLSFILGITVSIMAQVMVIEKTDSTLIRINVDDIQRAYFDLDNNTAYNDIGNVQKWSDFSFLFFSDLHANAYNLTNILNYADSIGPDIDCIINGGDIVASTMNAGLSWYNDIVDGNSIPVLAVPGNHDCWVDSHWNWADGTAIYNLITKKVKENVPSIVQPANAEENGLNYYYKDFGHIRVICIIAMSTHYYDSAQATWLEGVLESARTTYHYWKIVNKKPVTYNLVEGDLITAVLANDAVLGNSFYYNAAFEGNIYAVPMSVIIVNHCPFTPSVAERINSNKLNSWYDYVNGDVGLNKGMPMYDGLALSNGIDALVNTYINNGGSFICYLTGHTHVDNVLTHKTYSGQLMINIATANGNRHTDSAAATSKYDPNYDCFDHIGVDLRSGMIKVLRVGLAQDSAMRTRRRWCYDYVNQVLLSEE